MDEEDVANVIICAGPNARASVRLFNRYAMNDDLDGGYYDIRLDAPGLTAVVERVVSWAHNDIDDFLAALAADFRGWSGTRTWQSNDRDLRIEAEFVASGYVDLTWRISPWRQAAGRWDASVTVRLEAGEQLTATARDVRSFLRPD